MARDSCLARITAGVAVGGAVGGAVEQCVFCIKDVICRKNCSRRSCSFFNCSAFGVLLRLNCRGLRWSSVKYVNRRAVYGTYEAVRYKVPGLLKIRHIGQTTLGSAAIFGLFLGAGSLIHCGKSY